MNQKIIELELPCGRLAKFSAQDRGAVDSLKWYSHRARRTHYVRSEKREDGAIKRVYIHRLIMNAPPGSVVDHLNGNGLDNRRENLRVTSYSANSLNRHHGPDRILGTSWDKARGKWRAQIMVNYKNKFLGRFDRREDALAAYTQAYEELS